MLWIENNSVSNGKFFFKSSMKETSAWNPGFYQFSTCHLGQSILEWT